MSRRPVEQAWRPEGKGHYLDLLRLLAAVGAGGVAFLLAGVLVAEHFCR